MDGDDRTIDDPAVPDTGNGAPPIVDMGADEFDPSKPLFGDGFETGECDRWSAMVTGAAAGHTCGTPFHVTDDLLPVELVGTFDDDPAVGGSCDTTPNNVVWFTYTPDTTDIYRIDLTNGSSTNAYSRVAVFETTSCSPYGTELTCVTATSKSISAEVTLTADATYLIPFYTDGEVYTMVDPLLEIEAIGPDPGTACTNPYDVTGATFPVQLTGTFDDDPAVGGSCDATPTNVVWFSYTPDATDIYRIDLVNNSDTNAYSRVAVFESTSCSPYGTELTCVTATSKSISAEVTLTAGTSYLIPFFTDGDVYTMIDPEITITAPP
jgi:hypothetical protein